MSDYLTVETINELPLATAPQPYDSVAAWQDGQSPHTRQMTLAQIATQVVTISDVPPVPAEGALWFDSVSAELYLGYNDGTSTQWVIATNMQGGVIQGGPWLPLTGGIVTGSVVIDGGLNVGGNVTVTGQIYAGSSAYISPTFFVNSFNTWEWYFTVDPNNGNKIQNYRAQWYDYWEGDNGTRHWVGPNFQGGVRDLMNLDGFGNLNILGNFAGGTVTASGDVNVTGAVRSSGGRVMSYGNSDNPTVMVWDLDQRFAGGMFLGSLGRLCFGGINGDGSYNGALWMTMNSGGIQAYSNISTTGDLFATGNVIWQGNATGNDALLTVAGAEREIYFSVHLGCKFDFHADSQQMEWWSNGNLHLVWRPSDWYLYNLKGAMAGYGGYQNLACDARTKRDVQDTEVGLAEVMRLRPVSFVSLFHEHAGRQIAFVADEVHDVIPQAAPIVHDVGDLGTQLSLETTPIVAALVNGMKELNRRLEALERERSPHE